MKKFKILTLSIALAISCLISSSSFAQNKQVSIDSYLRDLPKNIDTKKAKPYKMFVTSKWENRQIDGNFMNSLFTTGYFTIGLDSNRVRWNNVLVKRSIGNENTFSDAQSIDCLEGFTYKIPSIDFLKEGFYKNCPAADLDLIRNMIMDPMISYFGFAYFDSLKINVPFKPQLEQGNSIKAEFENYGSDKIANLELIWTGVSKINGVLCAIITYRSHSNLINLKTKDMEVVGQSHWWGNYWISLSDKHLEYMTLYEDAPCKISMQAIPTMFINIHREIVFEHVK